MRWLLACAAIMGAGAVAAFLPPMFILGVLAAATVAAVARGDRYR